MRHARRLLIGVVAVSLFVGGCGPTTGLAHFVSDGLEFDYPSAWRVLEKDLVARHYQVIDVVGTGSWALNCASGSNWVTCGSDDLINVSAGQIVVEISSFDGPGLRAESPDPRASPLPSGWPAYDVESSTRSTWWVYWGQRGSALTIDAHFAEPGTEQARAEVRALVESLRP